MLFATARTAINLSWGHRLNVWGPELAFLAICAIVRNEGSYVKEWLSFHKFAGVEKFLIYDNGSTDGTRQEIEDWNLVHGGVTVISWPGFGQQNAAYEHAIKNYRDMATWCAFIDCDEFLVPQGDFSIEDVLRYFSPICTGLYVHWFMFGSSGILNQWPGFVTETFRRRAAGTFAPHRIGKTIVQMGKAYGCHGSHWIMSSGGTINDSEDEILPGSEQINYDPSHRFLALNHYYTKSVEEWVKRRAFGRVSQLPGNPDFLRNMADFKKHDRNEVFDNLGANIVSQVRESVFYQVDSSILRRDIANLKSNDDKLDFLGTTVEFGLGGNSTEVTRAGFAQPEYKGTWSDGKAAQLVLPLPRTPVRIELCISLSPFLVEGQIEEQTIEISVGSTIIYERKIGNKQHQLSLRLPNIMFDKQSSLSIKFKFPDAVAPASLELSPDLRMLGFFFETLTLTDLGRVRG